MEKPVSPPRSLLFKIPFVTTSLITDIILYFVLLPIWWILGVTQFLGPVLMIFLFIKLLLRHSRLKTPLRIPYLLTSGFILLMISMLLSGLHIRESYWIPVFFRNFILYVSAFCLFLIVFNSCRTKENTSRLIMGLTILSLAASVVGIMVLTGILPLQITATAPVSRLLPDSIAQSGFFEKVIHPDFGDYKNILGWKLKRLSSIFISPNSLAAFLIMVLPLQFFLWKYSTPRQRILLSASIPLGFVCLISTFSRGAAAALPMGFLFFLFLKFKGKQSLRKKMTVAIAGGLFVLAILGTLISGSRFVTDIKPQSDVTRMLILQKSIESLRESPVFGWGTQRNMQVVDLDPEIKPLGSHSTYLAYLYRYGLSGLLIFTFLYAVVFIQAVRWPARRGLSPYQTDLGLFAGWAFVNNAIQSLVTVMDYDVSILFLIWLIWGLLITIGSTADNRDAKTITGLSSDDLLGREVS